MAMFRSLVASAQQRQPPGGPAGGDSGLEAQYSCPICLEVYHRPVAIGSCGHTGSPCTALLSSAHSSGCCQVCSASSSPSLREL
ncbi:hypothetical protein J1605_006903 [Eschrichtius robustus]|uniref:Uncharacterized protein n=1 Tax=Eschrichtius robustus TaxID=9764 RepID=A0AB34H0U7_ESCRO|nr:hypothetical protein J1605_006903 [Eschrichtius robustus]